MKKTKLNFFLGDIDHGVAIGEYLANHAPEFEVVVHDIKNMQTDDLEGADYIITDEKINARLSCLNNKGIDVILLSEKPRDENDSLHADESPVIFKYCPAPRLLSELRFICSCGNAAGNVDKMNPCCIFAGFWGGGSGTGKTVVAIGLARDIAKRFGRRVLYLNFENYPSTKAYFQEAYGGKRTISDFLYYLYKNRVSDRVPGLDTFIFQDSCRVSGFYPDEGQNELKSLTIEELGGVLSYLESQNRFDYIFIDFSSEITEGCLFMIERCRILYLVQDHSKVNAFKNGIFENHLKLKASDSLESKTVRIMNKQTLEAKDRQGVFNIPLDGNSFFEYQDIVQISIGGAFGNSIRNIGDSLIGREAAGQNHA